MAVSDKRNMADQKPAYNMIRTEIREAFTLSVFP